jgi:hypothetical protein
MEVRMAFAADPGRTFGRSLIGQQVSFTTDAKFQGQLAIAAATPLDDGRTIALATDPHPANARFSLPSGVAYDLAGVEAAWTEGQADDARAVTTWWPSLDNDRARAATKGSAEHERFFAGLSKEGRLTLKAQVVLPRGKQAIRLASNVPVHVELNNAAKDGTDVLLEFDVGDVPDELIVVMPTGKLVPTLRANLGTTDAALSAKALMLPWAPPPTPVSDAPLEVPFDLKGGDARRGEQVFYSEESKCAVCHKVGEKGGTVGPDLTRPRQKDLLSLYRAIAAPSDEIRPDYVPYTIATNDGQVAAASSAPRGPIRSACSTPTGGPRSSSDRKSSSSGRAARRSCRSAWPVPLARRRCATCSPF